MAERVHIPGLRGLCGTRKGDYLVRGDGTLRYHGPHPRPCKGSGSQPTALRAPGGKWKTVER